LAGQGTFGTVLDVYDRKRRMRLALKVVRAVDRYTSAAGIEVHILRKLQASDVHGESLCVRLVKTFKLEWKGHTHMCLGFEKLGRSLYDFMKRNSYRGFRLVDVKHLGFQLLLALAFCHRAGLVHTDLKPENILLCNSDYYESALGDPAHVRALRRADDDPPAGPYRVPAVPKVRLIDFGGGILPEHHHTTTVNTRQYRSPEVLLALPWSYPSDIWSAACILAELFTGELLFNTHDDLEHLALMERVLEKPCLRFLMARAVEPFEQQHLRDTSSGGSSSSSSSSSSRRDRDRDRDRDYRGAAVDVYSRLRARRHERESHSHRYTAEHDRHRRAEARARLHSDEARGQRAARDDEKAYLDASLARLYPPRDWHQPRERSNSTMRADALVRVDNHQLRWPENAVDRASVQYVRRARTLKSFLFSGFHGQHRPAVDADTQRRLQEAHARRAALLESIRASAGEAVGVPVQGSNSNVGPGDEVAVHRSIEDTLVVDTRDGVAQHDPPLEELYLFYDLLCQMLQYDPSKRMTARTALFHPFFDSVRDLYRPPRFLEDVSPLEDHAAAQRRRDEKKRSNK
jgi:serine/threonine protein kinase